MNDDFYSDKSQLRRELRGRWHRLGRGNLLTGTIITLLSFYALNSPGHSQVYDVALPCVFVAAHLVLLIFNETHAERTRPTAAFFFNLPRKRGITFIATTLFFLGHALYYEFVIALGVFLKLGDADITPIYRVHPEMMVLPFMAVFGALWYCHRPRNTMQLIGSVAGLVLLIAALVARHMLKPQPSPENNFLPLRDFPLGLEWGMALLLLAIGISVCWRLRGELPHAERGGA